MHSIFLKHHLWKAGKIYSVLKQLAIFAIISRVEEEEQSLKLALRQPWV